MAGNCYLLPLTTSRILLPFLFRAHFLSWIFSACPSSSTPHLSLCSGQVADLSGGTQWAPLPSVFWEGLTHGVPGKRWEGGRKREIAVLYPSPPPLLGCLGLAMSLDSRSLLIFRKPLLHDTLPLGLVTTYVSSSQHQEYTYQLGISALKL